MYAKFSGLVPLRFLSLQTLWLEEEAPVLNTKKSFPNFLTTLSRHSFLRWEVTEANCPITVQVKGLNSILGS